MLKATKKVYMSILAILLVFITVVATTFAWVGILTYAQTDTFKMNLKVQDLDNDYYLSISATDEIGTYSDTADLLKVKRQILENMDISTTYLTDNQVDAYFYKYYQIAPVTTSKTGILNDEFYELNPLFGAKSLKPSIHKNYYKFDLYLSMEHREGDGALENATKELNLILSDITQTLTGEIAYQAPATDFKYPDSTYPSSSIYNPYGLDEISGNVYVDAASAARIALAIYDPINRSNDPATDEKYDGTEDPRLLYIYQGGTKLPTYDESLDRYSFGGILPEEFNIALNEHKINRNIKRKTPDNLDDVEFPITAEAAERGDLETGDLELIEENKNLFDSNFGFGVYNGQKKKVKITVYFWFEGWDADCFEIIDAVNVKINLNFATDSNIA